MSIDVTVKDIQFKRAATEDKIPILNDGEPAISKDSKSLFIGNGGKNIKISPVEIVNNLDEENTGKSLDASQGKILKDLVNNLESKKVDKVAGKDLSTNDFTTVEKKKLAAIEEGANKYVHPTKHAPADISTDSLNRFVTDAEKENWSSKETTEGSQSKADAALASAKTYTDTKTANKVEKIEGKDLSSNDYTTTEKAKLAGIDDGANKYVHPATHEASMVTTDATHRFVTDTEKANWSAKESVVSAQEKADKALAAAKTYTDEKVSVKVDKIAGKDLSSNDYTAVEKTKLAGIAEGANKYVHPATHAPADIATDANNRFVSDIEKETWNAKETVEDSQAKADKALEDAKSYTNEKTSTKVDKVAGKELSSNDYTTVEKTKLAGIAEGANKYVHPATHSPAEIATDTKNRFVSDAEKADWNAKETAAGSQAKSDKALSDSKTYTDAKVSALVDSAPESLNTLKKVAAALGDDPDFATTVSMQLKTKSDKTYVDTGLSSKVDKITGKGLSSNDYTTEEKTKLAGIAVGANKYVHPASHGPSEIATDSNNRFVTDAEKSTWNSKETTTGAQSKATQALTDAKTYTDEKVSIKVDKVAGKGLSTNDYTTAEKTKLAGLSKVEVANTLTEATVGKALDAVQGKVLNDMIAKLDKSAALKYRGSQFDEAKKNGIDIEGASFEEIYDFVVNDGYYYAYNAGNIEFALVLNLKDENENDYIFQQIVQGLGNPQDAPEGKISVVYRARRAVQQTDGSFVNEWVALDGGAALSRKDFTSTVTLKSSGWADDFTQTINVSGLKNTSTIYVYPYTTSENVEAITSCMIAAVACTETTVTFKALGNIVPAIDVTFLLKVEDTNWIPDNVISLTQVEYESLSEKKNEQYYLVRE